MRRDTAIAVLLSFIVPGLGQLYAGQLKRGVLCYALFVMWLFTFMAMVVTLPFGRHSILLFYTGSFIARVIAAIDAALTARKQAMPYQPKSYNKWYVYVGAIVILSVINPTYLIPFFIAGAVRIPTGSMQDTVLPGDHVLINKMAYNVSMPITNHVLINLNKPKRGDIVVFRYPENPSTMYMHRVIALPGDKVEVKGKELYINDKLIPEPYAKFDTTLPFAENYGPKVIPDNQFFVMGDNRNNSADSRHWGFVPLENLIGKARGIYLSENINTGEMR